VEGIKGTAPVGSFKPNTLGFYDLGGNAWEWMWEGLDEKTGKHVLRGTNWDNHFGHECRSSHRFMGQVRLSGNGLRLVRRSGL
jgi:formylglycine-generating enzyme required for sulfatase activity